MTRPLYGSRLLRTAKRLAGVGAGRGRPALSDLRRATSTAYYALFHQLVRHGAFDFLPEGGELEVAEIARWYTHTGLLDAAGLVIDATSSSTTPNIKKANRTSVMAIRTAADGAIHPDVVTVADAFQTLQVARHLADYDGNYDPLRSVTVNHVQDAEAALKKTWSLWRAGSSPRQGRQSAHATYLTFLRLALLKSGGPRTR